MTLTNGGSTNFTLTVKAPSNAATLTNTVASGATTQDPVPTNNDGSAAGASVTTTVTAQADVQTTKTGPASVLAAANFSYTITVTNMGPSTAAGILVTDTLPAGVTFVSATGSGTTNVAGQIVWPSMSLTNGGSTNFTLTVTAPVFDTTLTNTVA